MYKITEIQDVSRPRCNRYVVHIEVEKRKATKVKRAIEGATEEVRKLKDPAHVVWLYVWYKRGLLCRTMWVDRTLEDVPRPKPLGFNDSQGNIGIMWL